MVPINSYREVISDDSSDSSFCQEDETCNCSSCVEMMQDIEREYREEQQLLEEQKKKEQEAQLQEYEEYENYSSNGHFMVDPIR